MNMFFPNSFGVIQIRHTEGDVANPDVISPRPIIHSRSDNHQVHPYIKLRSCCQNQQSLLGPSVCFFSGCCYFWNCLEASLF